MPNDKFEKCMAYFHWRRMFIAFSFPAVAIGLLSARTDAGDVQHDRSCECEMLTAVALNN